MSRNRIVFKGAREGSRKRRRKEKEREREGKKGRERERKRKREGDREQEKLINAQCIFPNYFKIFSQVFVSLISLSFFSLPKIDGSLLLMLDVGMLAKDLGVASKLHQLKINQLISILKRKQGREEAEGVRGMID